MGNEYLWQGDKKYWGERSLVLFPFIARLTNDSYTFKGEKYHMTIHGFAKKMPFEVVSEEKSSVTMRLHSNEETKKDYPFDFNLDITYFLEDKQLFVFYRVENESDETMSFAIGGHPGFNVPMFEGEKFEDYTLEFSLPSLPDRVGFTSSLYLSGEDKPYPLRKGTDIDLEHELFDDDAVILKNACREVSLVSKNTRHGIAVSCPFMPYIGFWHRPETDAPYVCIEPWSSLPARQDIVEEISTRSDFIHLGSKKTYENTWSIRLI